MTTDEDGDIEVCTSQLDEGVARSVLFLLGLMVPRKKRVKAEPPIAATKIGSIFLIGKNIDMSFLMNNHRHHAAASCARLVADNATSHAYFFESQASSKQNLQ